MLFITPVAAQASSEGDLRSALAHELQTIKKDQSVVRFFDAHRWLLTDPRFQQEAQRRLSAATRRLAATQARAAKARARLAASRTLAARAVRLSRSPRAAICAVFGPHCGEALAVARCESGFHTTAQNGQYLGLFQMGSQERRLFGHGPSALAQAKAAHRYFLASGRDWSPWACKP